jgi:hypothetical protein
MKDLPNLLMRRERKVVNGKKGGQRDPLAIVSLHLHQLKTPDLARPLRLMRTMCAQRIEPGGPDRIVSMMIMIQEVLLLLFKTRDSLPQLQRWRLKGRPKRKRGKSVVR